MALIKAGVCLYLQTKGQDKHHLYVVLNDPVDDPPSVAVVNFSTELKSDRTVVLNPGPGMHPFIKEETCVVFGWARLLDANALEKLVEKDMSKRHHKNCSDKLLEVLRAGIFESPHVKQGVQEYCKRVFPAKAQPAALADSKRDS